MPPILIISTLAMLAGLLLTWLVHSRGRYSIIVEPGPEKQPSLPAGTLPLISVIIPARNEQRNIRPCLEALFAQDYPNYEIIVVDDRSSDNTASILAEMAAENPLLQVMHGAEPPPGWVGKPHALVQGAAISKGEWLCFIDADTFAGHELLQATHKLADELGADMFSILTRQVLGSFWERTILPLVFLGLAFGFPAEVVNDPHKPDAISNGQFILIKREVYLQIGGHAVVRDRIDEDRALAERVKRAGYHLVLADGRNVARTRMYSSLAEMWEGWTKNIYIGMQGKHGLLLFGAVLGVLVALVLPLWLIGSLAWAVSGGGSVALAAAGEAAVLWAFLLWQRSQACRYFNISRWYALTFPLGALVFTLMMLASTFNVISRRGVSWKGRLYK